VAKLDSRVHALESKLEKSSTALENKIVLLSSKVDGIVQQSCERDNTVKDCVERVLDDKTREVKERGR